MNDSYPSHVDGHSWRKYARKPVKDSPYRRHYYRCTEAGCNVKRQVHQIDADHYKIKYLCEGKTIDPIAHSHLTVPITNMQFG